MASIEETAVLSGLQERPSPTMVQLKSIIGKIRGRAAWFGFGGTALVTYAGWIGRHERNISAENGLGYVLGIVGASMMAALLIYPLRKRIRALRVLGSTRKWFFMHMVLGIIGPVLILYHCSFTVGSLNSQVALFCTLLVACSGIVGRYLYAQIHHGLYGGKRDLNSLIEDLQRSQAKFTVSGSSIETQIKQLAAVNEMVLTPPKNILHGALRPLFFAFRTRWLHLRMRAGLRRDLNTQAEVENLSAMDRKNNLRMARRDISRHLKQVRKVAHLSFYERLFSLWHILHLPFFLMLVISAIFHVIAVHMY